MPGNPQIRWRNQDIKLLQKTVKNFNAKISRILKKNPAASEYLPAKVSVKQIRAEIDSRQDFNNLIRSLQRFSRKGAEKPVVNKQGVIVTSWERKEVGYKVAKINRFRTRERKRVNPQPGLGNMKTIEEMNLSPKNIKWEDRSKKSWDAFKQAVERQAKSRYNQKRAELYKENYIKALNNVFGMYADPIVAVVNQVDGIWLANMYGKDYRLELDYVYGAQDMMAKINTIMHAFAEYGYTNPDYDYGSLDGFTELEEDDFSWLDDY